MREKIEQTVLYYNLPSWKQSHPRVLWQHKSESRCWAKLD